MSAKTGEAEDEAGKWLNMIARTSLLFNTKKELAEHIGYPALTNNNNLSKIKGDFKKRAILHELGREAKEYTYGEFDIEAFLRSYEEASKFFIRKMEGKSGHTIIQVDKNGQNCILLYGGSNRTITNSHCPSIISIKFLS